MIMGKSNQLKMYIILLNIGIFQRHLQFTHGDFPDSHSFEGVSLTGDDCIVGRLHREFVCCLHFKLTLGIEIPNLFFFSIWK